MEQISKHRWKPLLQNKPTGQGERHKNWSQFCLIPTLLPPLPHWANRTIIAGKTASTPTDASLPFYILCSVSSFALPTCWENFYSLSAQQQGKIILCHFLKKSKSIRDKVFSILYFIFWHCGYFPLHSKGRNTILTVLDLLISWHKRLNRMRRHFL